MCIAIFSRNIEQLKRACIIVRSCITTKEANVIFYSMLHVTCLEYHKDLSRDKQLLARLTSTGNNSHAHMCRFACICCICDDTYIHDISVYGTLRIKV